MILTDKNSKNELKLEMEMIQNNIKKEIKQLEDKFNFYFWNLYKSPYESVEDAKKRFYMTMPKATGFLRKLQLVLTDILDRFSQICEKNGIKYWVTAGTAIGAIRHQGFIPWDDDIDIQMPRHDLMKLKKILENDSFFKLEQTFNLTDGCRHEVLTCEPYTFLIDIFPIEIYNSDNSPEEEFANHVSMRSKLIKELKNEKELIEKYPHWKFIRDKKDLKIISSIFDKYDRTECVYGKNRYYSLGIDCLFNKGYIAKSPLLVEKIKKTKFEWIEVYAPEDLETYLTLGFGDYFEPPKSFNGSHYPEKDFVINSINKYIQRQYGIDPNLPAEIIEQIMSIQTSQTKI